MMTARLFLNNKSQAVRLPKAAEYSADVHEVSIVRLGNTRIITPLQNTWDAWFAQASEVDAQIPAREQPPMQQRKVLR